MGKTWPALQSSLYSHAVINASLAAYSKSLQVSAGTADVGQLPHVGKTVLMLCLQGNVLCNGVVTKLLTLFANVCTTNWFVLLQGQREDEVAVQAEGSWQAGAPTDLQPFESTNPRNTSGHHINVVLKPGASQVNCLQ